MSQNSLPSLPSLPRFANPPPTTWQRVGAPTPAGILIDVAEEHRGPGMGGFRWAIGASLAVAWTAAAEAPKADDAATFFKSGPIPRLVINLDDENLAQLRKSDREYARCTVRDGTSEFAEVGLHLKGAAGSYRP